MGGYLLKVGIIATDKKVAGELRSDSLVNTRTSKEVIS